MSKVFVLVFAMTFSLITSDALATSTIYIPQYLVCSNNQEFCAVVDKKTGVNVYKVSNRSYFPLWKLRHKFDLVYWPDFLSNDGRYLLEVHSIGRNDDQIIFSVYQKGGLKYSIPVKNIIKDSANIKKGLLPQFSYDWGHSLGFDSQGRFIVRTIENRRLAIEIETGKITEQTDEACGSGMESCN